MNRVLRRTENRTGRDALSLAALIALAVLVLTAPGGARGDEPPAELRLRAQATITGTAVTLGDVLVFGRGAEELAEQIAGRPLAAGGAELPATVTHAQVSRRLGELGVNLGRVLLSGPVQCRIVPAAPPASQPVAPAEAPLLRPTEEVGGQRTLAAVLRSQVQQEFAELGGTVELSFERAGQEFLQLTSPPWSFTVSTSGRGKLGVREFHVVIRGAGEVQRRVDIVAQARLVRPVVIARRPLNVGSFVRSDDVELQARVFEAEGALGVARLEEVVGQQVKVFVPAGDLVSRAALKSVDLVARSRPVTVTGDGPVQVRLTGVALDSGTYGDTVRVRLGDARGEKRILRGVVTGLGTVKLAEGGA